MIGVSAPDSLAGTFKDRDGSEHQWAIDDAHTLTWDGAPYLPFGLTFKPKYLSAAQTEENLAIDRGDLEAYKLAGIKDVLIRPGKGISTIPVEAWQKFVDLLDESGLTYGIELDDSPYTPLTGYVIDPVANRVSGIRNPGTITRELPDTKFAFYALCDSRTSVVIDSGKEMVAGGTLSVQANVEPGIDHVLLYFPEKTIAPGSADWSLPDLWSDVDTHRDRLAAFLPKIKFGKGLRFFIDPFGEQLGARGEAEFIVPTSAGFRMEYAAWLTRKYRTINDLKVAWSVLNYEIASFDEAVRLVPMWRQGRGLSIVFDDKTGRDHDVNVPNSAIWSDLMEFRADSVRQYMDRVSDVLKRTVADVPVVFTANEMQPFFQGRNPVGFDGLAVSGRGQNVAAQGGAVFSLAEHSSRHMWLVSRIGADGGSFEKKDQLFGRINGLRDLGMKAFFVDETAVSQTASGADTLMWLAEYAATAAKDNQFAAFRPVALYYPTGMPKASIRRLSGGTWWLPSLLPGQTMVLGSKLSGYVLMLPRGITGLFVWAPAGPTSVHLPWDQTVTVTKPSGEAVEAKPKKNRVELMLTDEPSMITGIPPEAFLPVEVVEEALAELTQVIATAEGKGMDVSGYKDTAKRVGELIKNNSLFIGLDMARTSINELKQRMQGLQTDPKAGGQKTVTGDQ